MTAACSCGTRNSRNSRLGRNCVPISASNDAMPSPVVAEIATAWGFFLQPVQCARRRPGSVGVEPVHFVENHQRRFFARADFGQHGVHGGNLFLGLRMADVHDVQQQIRLHHFLQRRLERLDQPVRQFADETRPCPSAKHSGSSAISTAASSGRAWRTKCPSPERPRR
jgi:hypothetical protein